MLKTFLIRLWQQVTQGFAHSQANDQVEEVEARALPHFHRHKVVATNQEHNFNIKPVEDDFDIDPRTKRIWVGSVAERLKISTYVRDEDSKIISKGDWPNPPNDISALEQFERNPKLKEAYQKAAEAYRKELEG